MVKTIFGIIAALIIVLGYYLAFGGAAYWTFKLERYLDHYDELKGEEK